MITDLSRVREKARRYLLKRYRLIKSRSKSGTTSHMSDDYTADHISESTTESRKTMNLSSFSKNFDEAQPDNSDSTHSAVPILHLPPRYDFAH